MYSIFFPSTRTSAARVRTRAYRLPALSRLLLPPPDLRRFFLPPPALRFAPSPLAPPPSNSELAELPTVVKRYGHSLFLHFFTNTTSALVRRALREARRWRVDRSSPSRSLATDELPTTRERQLRAPFDAGEELRTLVFGRLLASTFSSLHHIFTYTPPRKDFTTINGRLR